MPTPAAQYFLGAHIDHPTFDQEKVGACVLIIHSVKVTLATTRLRSILAKLLSSAAVRPPMLMADPVRGRRMRIADTSLLIVPLMSLKNHLKTWIFGRSLCEVEHRPLTHTLQ